MPCAKVAFAGGVDCNDHRAIWDALDKALAKHPDMVLLHGGSPKGAEFIAARWADARKVTQIVFTPDWTRHGKAAPFWKRRPLSHSLPQRAAGPHSRRGRGATRRSACR